MVFRGRGLTVTSALGATLLLVAILAAGVVVVSTGCGATVSRAEYDRRVAELELTVADLRARLEKAEAQNRALTEQLDRYMVATKVYFVVSAQDELWLTPVFVRVAKGQGGPAEALAALIAGPPAGAGGGLTPPLPADTRVLGLTVKAGLATVNFSREITRLGAGARGEALALAAIANTLTEFEGIQQVQLLVEGQRVESIGGHIDASGPLSRNMQVVRTGP